ncbi:unnamed protein product [Anisakis simplex]|uniref:PWWP domain-containing protein n=1 Tax=Anisakis simplex TaxID=6269 RepID=A0A0M3K4X7_ANISI|nr:unnamed protein product [Anisakis simplex]
MVRRASTAGAASQSGGTPGKCLTCSKFNENIVYHSVRMVSRKETKLSADSNRNELNRAHKNSAGEIILKAKFWFRIERKNSGLDVVEEIIDAVVFNLRCIFSAIGPGDIVWAPYRRTPEWPSVVRNIYPKKITYVFLPLPEDQALKAPVFNCPPSKVHLFSQDDTLPANADAAMKEAFEEALKLAKERGQMAPPRPVISSASRNGSSSTKKAKNEEAVVSNAETGSTPAHSHRSKSNSNASSITNGNKRTLSGGTDNESSDNNTLASTSNRFTPAVNDIVWLISAGHPAWPVLRERTKLKMRRSENSRSWGEVIVTVESFVKPEEKGKGYQLLRIRHATKKLVMIDSFPLTGKSERYPQSACEKFDLSERALASAIKREHNPELKEALQAVQAYRLDGSGEAPEKAIPQKSKNKTKETTSNSIDAEKNDQHSEENGKTEEVVKKEDEQEDDSKADVVGEGGNEPEKEDSKDVVKASDENIKKEIVGNINTSKRANRDSAKGMPGIAKKRAKFSEEMRDLEQELATKLENLKRGEIAWVKCAYDGGKIEKWPIVVLSVDRSQKTCTYLQLPWDDECDDIEDETQTAPLADIFLYDSVVVDKEDISNEALKVAVNQADEICEGKFDPLQSVDSSVNNDNANVDNNSNAHGEADVTSTQNDVTPSPAQNGCYLKQEAEEGNNCEVDEEEEEEDDEKMEVERVNAEEISEGAALPDDMKQEEKRVPSLGLLNGEELFERCISQSCRKHLLSIWIKMKQSNRHAQYEQRFSTHTPLQFQVQIGNLIPNEDVIRLMDVLEGWIRQFKASEKSVTRRLHYVVSVALPEALVYAISELMQCSEMEANKILENATANDATHTTDTDEQMNLPLNTPAAPLQHLLRAVSKARSATLATGDDSTNNDNDM